MCVCVCAWNTWSTTYGTAVHSLYDFVLLTGENRATGQDPRPFDWSPMEKLNSNINVIDARYGSMAPIKHVTVNSCSRLFCVVHRCVCVCSASHKSNSTSICMCVCVGKSNTDCEHKKKWVRGWTRSHNNFEDINLRSSAFFPRKTVVAVMVEVRSFNFFFRWFLRDIALNIKQSMTAVCKCLQVYVKS